jgi:NADH-quinone oxidoreductase subunit N
MNVEATAITSGKPNQDWVSTTTLVVLTMLLVWFGIYPGLLINIIQSVSHAME